MPKKQSVTPPSACVLDAAQGLIIPPRVPEIKRASGGGYNSGREPNEQPDGVRRPRMPKSGSGAEDVSGPRSRRLVLPDTYITSDDECYTRLTNDGRRLPDSALNLIERIKGKRLNKSGYIHHRFKYYQYQVSYYLGIKIDELNRLGILTNHKKELKVLCKLINHCIDDATTLGLDGLMRDLTVSQTINKRTFNDCGMSLVAEWFQYFQGGHTYFSFLQAVHSFRLKDVLHVDAYASIDSTYSPFIDHSDSGMKKGSYITPATFMLSDAVLSREELADWAVLVHATGRMCMNCAFPPCVTSSIKKNIEDMHANITRIVIKIEADMCGSNPSFMVSELCFLLMKTNDRGGSLITILDEFWIIHDFNYLYLWYIDRLIQLRDIINKLSGWENLRIMVSSRCLKCLSTNNIEAYTESDLVDGDSCTIPWLKSMLTSESPIITDTEPADIVKHYKSVLYILGFIRQELPSQYDVQSFYDTYIHPLSDTLNHEISYMMLSGYCILTPYSIQKYLCALDTSRDVFFVVKETHTYPHNTYAWALGREADNLIVYALKYDSESDTTFSWSEIHMDEIDIHSLLQRLMTDSCLPTADKRSSELEWEGADMHMYDDGANQRMDNVTGDTFMDEGSDSGGTKGKFNADIHSILRLLKCVHS